MIGLDNLLVGMEIIMSDLGGKISSLEVNLALVLNLGIWTSHKVRVRRTLMIGFHGESGGVYGQIPRGIKG